MSNTTRARRRKEDDSWLRLYRLSETAKQRRADTRAQWRVSDDDRKRCAVHHAEMGYGVMDVMEKAQVSAEEARLVVLGEEK